MKKKISHLLLTILFHHSCAIFNSNSATSDANVTIRKPTVEKTANNTSRIIGFQGDGKNKNAVRISLIGDFEKPICSGAIQNALYIITSAQCITGVRPSQLVVTAGTQSPFEQNRSVVSFESHPGWDAKTFLNNLALLKLNDSLVLTYEVILPLELGKQNQMNRTLKKAWITGWGLSKGFGPNLTYHKYLKTLNVPLVDKESCQDIYHKVGKHVHENELCAGGQKGYGPCTGDTGAPLSISVIYTPHIRRDYTIGILSTYEGCATEFPAIFTDLEKYEDWIESKTGRQCDNNVYELDSASKKRQFNQNVLNQPKGRIDQNVAKMICAFNYQFLHTSIIQGPLKETATFFVSTVEPEQVMQSHACINWQWNTCVGCQKFIPVKCKDMTKDPRLDTNTRQLTRLIGEHDADPDNLPYQVLIYFEISGKISSNDCGGVIYNALHVLTSARCVSRNLPCEIKVFAGDDSKGTTQRRQVMSLLIHEGYTADDDQNNDIALLKLDSPFNFTKYVHSILLAKKEYPTAETTYGEVSRWSRVSFEDTEKYVLQTVKVPIIDSCDCRLYYSHKYYSKFSSYKLCAGMFGQGLCSDDFGNPVTVKEGGTKYLIGIASFSRACGMFPGIATKVSAYREWILMRAGHQ